MELIFFEGSTYFRLNFKKEIKLTLTVMKIVLKRRRKLIADWFGAKLLIGTICLLFTQPFYHRKFMECPYIIKIGIPKDKPGLIDRWLIHFRDYFDLLRVEVFVWSSLRDSFLCHFEPFRRVWGVQPIKAKVSGRFKHLYFVV